MNRQILRAASLIAIGASRPSAVGDGRLAWRALNRLLDQGVHNGPTQRKVTRADRDNLGSGDTLVHRCRVCLERTVPGTRTF